jgi:hypothetical protein
MQDPENGKRQLQSRKQYIKHSAQNVYNKKQKHENLFTELDEEKDSSLL